MSSVFLPEAIETLFQNTPTPHILHSSPTHEDVESGPISSIHLSYLLTEVTS